MSIKVLGSAGGQTEGGILCVAAGSRGTTLQSLPSHHILKSFSSQVLGSFTNSCCFIRAKLAHVRWTALWISIFNTVLFDCLNAGKKKRDCFHSFLCLSNQASQVCCKILTILGLGSRVEHCFIHPLWILVKTTFLFCFGVGFFFALPNQARRIFCRIVFVFCSALQYVLPNRDSVGWKQSTSTLLSFPRCYSCNVLLYDCLSSCLSLPARQFS